MNLEKKGKNNQINKLVGKVIGEEMGSVLERREGSLENFWLVALLPLQLVTSNIYLLDLIMFGQNRGPMPQSWQSLEKRRYESLCCWGILCEI